MNGPIDWAVNEMPSDFTIKIFIMAMLVTPCTVITTCLFQRLMWIMTTETETLKKAAALDFTRYLLFKGQYFGRSYGWTILFQDLLNFTYKGPFKYYVIKEVGGWAQKVKNVMT